jgi:hypothetical protein
VLVVVLVLVLSNAEDDEEEMGVAQSLTFWWSAVTQLPKSCPEATGLRHIFENL